jgi:regulator of replication initiation timing
MDNESKFIITAYQKKAFDLFNQVIVIEAKFQQQQELIEAQNAKIQEFAAANQQLVIQVKNLETHVSEREDQIKNITKAKRTTKRNPVKTEENVQDGGEF